jgi:hypothetical protein
MSSGAHFGEGKIQELLTRPRPAGRPGLLIPAAVQWRLASRATEASWADLILSAPEFTDAVKLSVARRAGTRSRVNWLARDPGIRDGDYLLETLDLALAGQLWAAVDLLGNRPSLAATVLDLELTPLYPAAARHTNSLECHARLVERVRPSMEWRLPIWIFDRRSDVPWLLRNRARLERSDDARPSERSRLDQVTRAWDAVTFAESGFNDVDLDCLPPQIGTTRRAAASVLNTSAPIHRHTWGRAAKVARASVVAAHIEVLSKLCSKPEPVPTDVLAAIEAAPLAAALAGETAGRLGLHPSHPPAPHSKRPHVVNPAERHEPRQRPLIVRHWWG